MQVQVVGRRRVSQLNPIVQNSSDRVQVLLHQVESVVEVFLIDFGLYEVSEDVLVRLKGGDQRLETLHALLRLRRFPGIYDHLRLTLLYGRCLHKLVGLDHS